MKNLIRLSTLCIIAGFLLLSCEGPMGPAGKDGKDANSACLKCHTTSNQGAKAMQYHLSKHFSGTSSTRNSKWCAGCHTNDGFYEITGAEKYLVSNDMPNATRISCPTCHEHTALDFAVDTMAQILRVTSPVYLNYDKNLKSTDFGKQNNLCANCHQIRGISNAFTTLPFFPFDNSKSATDTVQFRQGMSFSVHDGAQSNLFKGIDGFEYSGQSYTRTWKHSTNNCIDCHMNKYNPADSTGGHTMITNLSECVSCHNGVDRIGAVRTTIGAKLTELGNLLVARKVFNSSFSPVPTHDYNGLLYNGTTTRVYTSISSNTTVSPTTGLVIYGTQLTTGTDDAATAATRIGRPWKWGELGAAYNYNFIKYESPSGTNYGIHNPVYSLLLLQKSIDWLNAHP